MDIIVADIIGIITDAISGLLSAIGGGLVDVFETVIYNETDGLTGLAEWMLVFAGLSVAFGLFYAVLRKVL